MARCAGSVRLTEEGEMSCHRNARYDFALEYPVDWRLVAPGFFARALGLLTGSRSVMTLRGPDRQHLSLIVGPQVAAHRFETFRAQFASYANRTWGSTVPTFEPCPSKAPSTSPRCTRRRSGSPRNTPS